MGTVRQRAVVGEEVQTGQMARLAGVTEYQLLAAVGRGYLEEPRRFGRWRVWQVADLPRIIEALVRAGYREPADCAAAE